MSDLSLNLIAISVFIVTMSALLGPLVHLSPLVPTIATAGVLGLATLDTLNWQGKGSTLLLDWIARFSAAYRDRILRHEAGHFLVAHQLGIPVTGYTLSAWDAYRQGQTGQGGVQVDAQVLEANLNQGNLSEQLLDAYCTTWMAGVEAENLVYGTAQGGSDDRQKLRTILNQLRFSPADSQQKERWSALHAKTLLQDHWSTYEDLVAAMKQRASVAECHQILNRRTR